MFKKGLNSILTAFVFVGMALTIQMPILGHTTMTNEPAKPKDSAPSVTPRLLSLDPTGMAKPIADLRDYNGTYYGASGTGTIGYEGGTLYRDNEDNGVTSGCNGEGCGRHPGVDIPVPSGTTVYASRGGTVQISRCGTDGWGGLMVIQSSNPWNPSENIYFVYGHLKSRNYSAGQSVLTGQPIGLSGGGSGDPCRGNSTGSHLHFQLDKEDGNPEPYFPSSSALNQRDTDFQVTARTYNPIVFVTGGYRWSFNKPGERELWDLANWQRWGVSNDALWVDGVGDTFISRGFDTPCGQTRPCSSRIAAEANMYPKVYLDLYNVCFNNPGKIYFTTSTSPNFDEQKTVSYFPNSQGPYQAHIFMNQNPLWTGIITGLRIDPAVSCSSGDDPTYYGEITIER